MNKYENHIDLPPILQSATISNDLQYGEGWGRDLPYGVKSFQSESEFPLSLV